MRDTFGAIVGTADGRACSDFGFLTARTAFHPVVSTIMNFAASSSFNDSLTVYGGSGPVLVSVTFAIDGTRIGKVETVAGMSVAGASATLSDLGASTTRTIAALVNFNTPFQIQAQLFVGAPTLGNCPAADFGEADYTLRIAQLSFSSTNGVPITNATAVGNSGTLYYGCAQPPMILTNPQPVCICQSGKLAVSASTYPAWIPLFYQWRSNGVPVVGATNANFRVSLSATSPESYDVVVANACGSVTSSPAAVSFSLTAQSLPDGHVLIEWCDPADVLLTSTNLLTWTALTNDYSPYSVPFSPEPSAFYRLQCGGRLPSIVTQPPSALLGAGGSFTLCCVVSGQPPLSFQWMLNGTNIADATNSCLILNNLSEAQVGAYEVRVFNSYGSITSASAYVALSNDSGGLTINSTLAQPPATVLPVGVTNPGLPLNTANAQPATSLILVGASNTGQLAQNTSVAQPPISTLLVGAANSGLTLNTTVAHPPTSLLLVGGDDGGGLISNSTKAQPPIYVIWITP